MNDTETEFATSWGRSTWAITVIGVAVALAVAGYMLVLGASQLGQSGTLGTILVAVGIADLLSVVTIALLAPGQYAVKASAVVIRRLGPNIRIPLDDITEVGVADKGTFRGAIRMMASGGLFGYFGKFRSPELGKFDAYVTRWEGLVLIRRKSANPVVLSPDEPDKFAGAIQAALAGKEEAST